MTQDPWAGQVEALGRFIHSQRTLAKLSLRELASLSDLSTAYLSPLERGLHEPSIRVLRQVAAALEIPTETLLRQAGLFDDDGEPTTGDADGSAVEAIEADPNLTDEQRAALLAIYRGFAD